MTRSMHGNGAPELFSDPKFDFQDAQFSPDGRWMAYVSNETGRQEVWVRAFPGPGEKYPISAGGGGYPVWAPNQRELFYLTAPAAGKRRIVVVDIAPGSAFTFGKPRQLFDWAYTFSAPVPGYDITPDGQHFIVLRLEPQPDQRVTKLTVVLNWFDELRRRAPAK